MTDLNSTNGTYVNNEELAPMEAVKVPLGAEIIFGAALYVSAAQRMLTGKEDVYAMQVTCFLPNMLWSLDNDIKFI